MVVFLFSGIILSLELSFEAITCSVPTSILRVSPSSDVLVDSLNSSIDARGSFLERRFHCFDYES